MPSVNQRTQRSKLKIDATVHTFAVSIKVRQQSAVAHQQFSYDASAWMPVFRIEQQIYFLPLDTPLECLWP